MLLLTISIPTITANIKTTSAIALHFMGTFLLSSRTGAGLFPGSSFGALPFSGFRSSGDGAVVQGQPGEDSRPGLATGPGGV